MVLEKNLESPLDCKEIQPVNPKGDQSLVFIGRIDVEAETLIVWPPDVKSWLIWKDPDAGKDWGQEEKGTAEDEMAGWHHWLNGHGFGWTPGVGDGQGSLACCGSRGCKESDTTERLNWIELNNCKQWGKTWIEEKAYGDKPPSEIILSLWGNAHLSCLYFMTKWQVYKYLPQKEHLIHPSALTNPICLAGCVDILAPSWDWRYQNLLQIFTFLNLQQMLNVI